MPVRARRSALACARLACPCGWRPRRAVSGRLAAAPGLRRRWSGWAVASAGGQRGWRLRRAVSWRQCPVCGAG